VRLNAAAGEFALSSVKWITRRDWELIFRQLIPDEISIVQFVDTCLRIRTSGKTYLRDLQLQDEDGAVVYARSTSLESMGDDSAAQSPQHSPHEERGALDVTRTREGFEGLSTKGTEYKEKLNQRRASADDIQMNYERDYLQRRASPGLKWQRSTAIIMLAHEKGEKVGEVTEEDNSAEKV
jgi:hypothetical protein